LSIVERPLVELKCDYKQGVVYKSFTGGPLPPPSWNLVVILRNGVPVERMNYASTGPDIWRKALRNPQAFSTTQNTWPVGEDGILRKYARGLRGICMDRTVLDKNPGKFDTIPVWMARETDEKLKAFTARFNKGWGGKLERYHLLYGFLTDYEAWKYGEPGSLKNKLRVANGLPEWKGAFDSLDQFFHQLAQGIATPLRIKFTPPKPTFPLEISRLNKGYSWIEVYVFAPSPVNDANHILQSVESKKINARLKGGMSSAMGAPVGPWITLLNYRGDLSRLDRDAVFDRVHGADTSN
jgi:hypothetical protein